MLQNWDLWNSWWNFEYPRNSFPWMSSYSSSQPWTFPKLLNAPLRNLQRSTFFSVFFRTWFFYIIHNFCCVTSHNESFRFCLFLVINFLRFHRSIMNYLSVPCRLRISVEKRSSWWGTNLLNRIPRSFLMLPWSIVRRSSTFPTLEKTKIDRNPLVYNLVVTIAQVYLIDHQSGSWYPYHVSPGFDEVEDDTTDGILAVKFIKGLDFAVTRSSPDSFWTSFDIAAKQIVELKWLILNKLNKWVHSSRVKFTLVKMSASWFLISMYLIWILESRFIRSNNQSRATLWVLETCLVVGTPSFNDHLDHCFIVLKHIQYSFLTRGLVIWVNRINAFHHIDFLLRLMTFVNIIIRLSRSIWNTRNISKKQKQLDPIIPEQATHLISVQCPKRWFQILLNCEKQQFVSYTSNLFEQMYDFRICTMFLHPQNNIVCIHKYDALDPSVFILSLMSYSPWYPITFLLSPP